MDTGNYGGIRYMNGGRQNWFWVVFPANAAMAAFGTMLPLYVLSLGGTVLEVGSFVGIFTAVGIPASLFWGVLSDNPSRRRIFFTTTYAGMALSFVLMFELPTLGWLGILYAFLGFMIVANSSAANVLLMERMEEKSWVSGVAGISTLANLGALFGLATSIAVVDYTALSYILIFATAMSILSLLLTFLLISDPQTAATGDGGHAPDADWARPTIAGGGRRLGEFSKNLIRPFVTIYGRAMPLFFLSTFFFNLAMAYLNVSYIPFLSVNGVPPGLIFVVPLMSTAMQVATYVYVNRFMGKFGRIRVGEASIFFMMVLYILIATSGIVARGVFFILFNLLSYALAGLVFALWNSSTAVSLFVQIDPDQRGSIMGGYIGLSGLGSLAGSFLSGATSFYIGYVTTFVAAAILMGVALLLRYRFNATHQNSVDVGHRGFRGSSAGVRPTILRRLTQDAFGR